MHKTIVLLSSFFYLSPLLSHAQFDNWNFEKEVDGIKIYSKDSIDNDRIKCFGISMVIESDLESPLKVLRDVMHYNTWLNGVDTAIVEKSFGSNDFVYHVYISKSFIFYTLKRDAVAHLKMANSSEDLSTSRSTLVTEAVEDKDYVRLQHYLVDWRFERVDKRTIRVVYHSVADVEFPFAYFLLKGFIMDSVVKSFSAFREKVENL